MPISVSQARSPSPSARRMTRSPSRRSSSSRSPGSATTSKLSPSWRRTAPPARRVKASNSPAGPPRLCRSFRLMALSSAHGTVRLVVEARGSPGPRPVRPAQGDRRSWLQALDLEGEIPVEVLALLPALAHRHVADEQHGGKGADGQAGGGAHEKLDGLPRPAVLRSHPVDPGLAVDGVACLDAEHLGELPEAGVAVRVRKAHESFSSLLLGSDDLELVEGQGAFVPAVHLDPDRLDLGDVEALLEEAARPVAQGGGHRFRQVGPRADQGVESLAVEGARQAPGV